jgi:muramoyltetrapeptide carboxypeptidase
MKTSLPHIRNLDKGFSINIYFMFKSCKKGDIIDIVFPATSCTTSEILAIKNYAEKYLNLKPRIFLEKKLIHARENQKHEFPLNSPKDRFAQLRAALTSSDSKIVWCARGGYGSGDLLPFLEEIEPVKQNKLFIGFSDIVSISDFMQRNWGWNIICGPVLLQLAKNELEKEAQQELKDMIFLKKKIFTYELELLSPENKYKDINGQICGGCLSVLAGHFGGKYQIYFNNKILFLEDEGEDGERLDRYFRQIVEIIVNHKQIPKAILLGNFLQANTHGTPKAKNINIAIENFIKRIDEYGLNIAIFKAKNSNLGHSDKMRPLLLGHNSDIYRKAKNFMLKYEIF